MLPAAMNNNAGPLHKRPRGLLFIFTKPRIDSDWDGLFAGKPRSYSGRGALVGARLAREGALTITAALIGLRQKLNTQIQCQHPIQPQRINPTQLGNPLHAITQTVAMDAQGIGAGLALAVVIAPTAQGRQ